MWKKPFTILLVVACSLFNAVPSLFSFSLSKASASPSCPVMYLAVVPGTWETNIDPYQSIPRGMLDNVIDRLPSDLFKVVKVRYPARAFPYEDAVYGVSKQEGTRNTEELLVREAEKCPNTKLGVLGFSQGADAAGDLAAKIGREHSDLDPSLLDSVVLISDPRRSMHDNLVGPWVPGEGAGGARPGGFGVVRDRVVTICARGDLYCSLPESEYWGRLAGFIAENSGPIKDTLPDTTEALFTIINSIVKYGGLPRLVNDIANNRFRKELRMYKQFNKSGAHTIYPNYQIKGETVPEWVANYLTRIAEEW